MAARQLTGALGHPRLTLTGVPVLVYHDVAALQPADKYAIAVERFREHLAFMRDEGYLPMSLAELHGGASVCERSVVLTFDDGLISAFACAFPLLSEAGYRADFFVSTANIGQPGFVTWDHLREMQRAGMRIHAHGHHHVDLSHVQRGSLIRELTLARELLQDNLGDSVEFLSMPYGLLHRDLIGVAEELGFRAICTSRPWVAKPGTRLIPRVGMSKEMSASDLHGLLARSLGGYVPRAVRAGLLWMPKAILLRLVPQRLGVMTLSPDDAEHAVPARATNTK